MRTLKITPRLYPEDPARFFNFERFEDDESDIYFFSGPADAEQIEGREEKKIVHLELEEPNCLWAAHCSPPDSLFYKIFTICPYTAEWRNHMQHTQKRVPCFFPFNENYIPPECEKKYDVIYAGHIVANSVKSIVDDISHFNYRFISQSNDPRVTDKNASYTEKLHLLAKSKIAVVANVLYPSKGNIITLWSVKGYRSNEAFRLIPPPYQFWKLFGDTERFVVPQIKSRVFEAAFAKTLILCRRDPFSIIERFFEPEKEFIYYEDGHLREKIEEILSDYDHFRTIAENAFKRAISEYTTSVFFEKYLKDLA